MKRIVSITLSLFFSSFIYLTFAQKTFVEVQIDDKYETSCLVYEPDSSPENREKPLLIYLQCHDAGEFSNSSIAKYVASTKNIPFYIVAPKCDSKTEWTEDELIFIISDLKKRYSIDNNRIYITGIGKGGEMAWGVVKRKPGLFSAVVLVDTDLSLEKINKLKGVSVWAFCQESKSDNSIELIESAINELNNLGVNAQVTIYGSEEGECEKLTYQNPDLYDWLWGQSR